MSQQPLPVDGAEAMQPADPLKRMATLRAQYALAGFELLELSDGSLLATRWNQCRPLPDATAALRFLRLIGGAA